ncbi:type I restriction enzyme S subunit [Winogradskyella eximia]|uniref:Type I restriction enzyme S subunit n=1 Tax=Winogradskyella eximia TaxID=262006 RepID=A0A3D9GZE2_9FLAO|nr:restriction endonuclease subunit S [Winogradskyella eximia]RED42628.1 type I restriction enzyme S subunit [Winogradskyella eximia]
MGKWKEVMVQDVAKNIQYGYTGKTIPIGDYRYLRITDIQNQKVNWDSVPISDITSEKEIEKYKLEVNDILFARTGATVGKSFLIEDNQPSIFASYLIRVQPKDVVFPKFLYLYFQSESYWKQIRGHEVGAAQPNVNGKKLGLIKFPLPPLPEQQRIVAKLDGLFAKIDQAMGLLEENIAHTQALMGSVLDAEFGRLEKLSIKYDKLKNLTRKIGSGSTPRGGQSSYKETGISLIRSMNVHDCYFKDKNLAFIDDEQADKLKNVEIQENDVLLNITGASVARCCIVDSNYLPARVNQHVSIIRTDESILPEFMLYFLISPKKKAKLLYDSSGNATREAITKSMIEAIEVPIVSLQIQQNLVDRIKSSNKLNRHLLDAQTQKLNHLKALKSSLLDQAFKGEL